MFRFNGGIGAVTCDFCDTIYVNNISKDKYEEYHRKQFRNIDMCPAHDITNTGPGRIFFTADLHLGHANILRFTERNFANIYDHDKAIIEAINSTVTKNDTLFILGDFAWRDHGKYFHQIHAKKILVTGSHDKMNDKMLRNFTEVHRGMLVRQFGPVNMVLTHCAMLVWEKSHYGAINLHGHSHGRLIEDDKNRRMDVGVDVSPGFKPFSLEFILYKMCKKQERNEKESPTEEELRRRVRRNLDNNTQLAEQCSIPAVRAMI